jgi:peptidoglycan/LPS O-acetylase OafA/YrhL
MHNKNSGYRSDVHGLRAGTLANGDTVRVVALDGLRGCACLFVLIHHYFTGIAPPPTGNAFFSAVSGILGVFFLSGVDLFYVLSGFLVGGLIIDHHKSQNFLKIFFFKRACRILPLYYLLILSYMLLPPLLIKLSALGAWADEWLLERPLPIWSYLTFLQSYVMGLENTSGPKWLAITWSVSVEEQFYLLMPLIFLTFGVRLAASIVIIGLLAAPMVRWHLFENVGFYAGYMFFPGRMDTILWGVLLAFLVRSPTWSNLAHRGSASMLVVAGAAFSIVAASNIGLINIPAFTRFTALAVFYFVVMWVVVEEKSPLLNKLLTARFLTFTGLISYAAYMVHQLINGLVHGLIFSSKPTMDSAPKFIATLLSILIVYAIGYLSYKYFESPILKLGKRIKYNSPSAATPIQVASREIA